MQEYEKLGKGHSKDIKALKQEACLSLKHFTMICFGH